MSSARDLFPVTQETAAAVYDLIFAPWLKEIGLTDFVISESRGCPKATI
jgi:hypothetical protein